MGFGAHALHAVLHHALHRRLSARVEIALHDALYVLRRGIGPYRGREQSKSERRAPHRLFPGP